jgi:exosortase
MSAHGQGNGGPSLRIRPEPRRPASFHVSTTIASRSGRPPGNLRDTGFSQMTAVCRAGGPLIPATKDGWSPQDSQHRLPPGVVPLLAAAACGLFAALFAERFCELARNWLEDDNCSHGFLVPFVSGFLLVRHLRRQGWPQQSDLGGGLIFLLAGCFLHLAAVVVWLPPLDFLALAALLHGGARAVGGRQWAAGLWFPILFLFFLFPLPAALTDGLSTMLQDVVTTLATFFLQLFLPAWRQGNWIFLPGQQLEVGEACSGLRQVVTFAALTLLVAHLSQRSLPFKAGLVVSGPFVAVAANVLRVLLMAAVLLHFGPGWLSGVWHTFWGLLTLGVGLGLLLGVGRWLAALLPESPRPRATAADPPPRRPHARPILAVVACLFLALVLQWALQAHLNGATWHEPPSLRQPLAALGQSLAGWDGEDVGRSQPSLSQADDAFERTYVLRDGSARKAGCRLVLVYHRDGSDRAHHPLVCYRVAGYAEDPAGRESVPLDDDGAPLRRFRFVRPGERLTVFYWHYTLEPSETGGLSSLQFLHQRLRYRLPSVTVQLVATAETPEARLTEFARQVDRQLRQDCLPAGARRGSDLLLIRMRDEPLPSNPESLP